MLGDEGIRVSKEELARMEALLRSAKKGGR
jgi:hypothetical protein